MKRFILLVSLLLCISACSGTGTGRTAYPCRVVIEMGEGFTAKSYTGETGRGGSLTFELREADGYTVTGTDYTDYTLTRGTDGLTLTLRDVRYTESVRISVERSDAELTYVSGGERVTLPVTVSHRRVNTATEVFTREGYTQTCWLTGDGEEIGLGSRVELTDGLTLEARWEKWTDGSLFTLENGTITEYRGDAEALVIPARIGGESVTAIAGGAFEDCGAKTVVLPDSIRAIRSGAFKNAKLTTLYLFDSVKAISDLAFEGCDELMTLHLNASEPPVYSGTYFATFADKYDRLVSMENDKKIVLFSGSSARFGYDSAAMDAAFPDCGVVNMGVFAYTNALPQLELIRGRLREGDILLLSPELDAAKRQFCTTNALDAPFWSMMEANYDMASDLDMREYSLVFSSLQEYLSVRDGMEKRAYSVSPSDYDEDGNPAATKSYNDYGDYILYRPNAEDDAPLYGLEVPYRADYYLKNIYIDPFNRETARFTDMGVRVYMTWSPRNRLAVSRDSTEEEINGLEAYFRESIDVPIISDIRDSLVPGKYLYGTDNHLTTEGAALRTQKIISELRRQLGSEAGNG